MSLTASDFNLTSNYGNSPVTQQQITNFNAAIAYISQDPVGAAVLQKLANSGTTINFTTDDDDFVPGSLNTLQPGVTAIDWNPNAATLVQTSTGQGVVSSAISFYHEAIHATDPNYDANVDAPSPVEGYPNYEEYYAVFFQNELAAAVGEPQQANYNNATPFNVNDVTLHTIQNSDGTYSFVGSSPLQNTPSTPNSTNPLGDFDLLEPDIGISSGANGSYVISQTLGGVTSSVTIGLPIGAGTSVVQGANSATLVDLETGNQVTVAGTVDTSSLQPGQPVAVTTPAGTYHIDPTTGDITDAGAVTATINGQTVTLLGLGGSSPFALISNDNSVTAGAVSSNGSLDADGNQYLRIGISDIGIEMSSNGQLAGTIQFAGSNVVSTSSATGVINVLAPDANGQLQTVTTLDPSKGPISTPSYNEDGTISYSQTIGNTTTDLTVGNGMSGSPPVTLVQTTDTSSDGGGGGVQAVETTTIASDGTETQTGTAMVDGLFVGSQMASAAAQLYALAGGTDPAVGIVANAFSIALSNQANWNGLTTERQNQIIADGGHAPNFGADFGGALVGAVASYYADGWISSQQLPAWATAMSDAAANTTISTFSNTFASALVANGGDIVAALETAGGALTGGAFLVSLAVAEVSALATQGAQDLIHAIYANAPNEQDILIGEEVGGDALGAALPTPFNLSSPIGMILGAVIGSMFGPRVPTVGPDGNAWVQWNGGTSFSLISSGTLAPNTDNTGGNNTPEALQILTEVEGMVNAAALQVSDALQAVGGTVVTSENLNFGYFKNGFFDTVASSLGGNDPSYQPGSYLWHSAGSDSTAEIQQAVEQAVQQGVYQILSATYISDGGLYVQKVMNADIAAGVSLEQFDNDMTVASDYQASLNGTVPSKTGTAQTVWNAELAEAAALGLTAPLQESMTDDNDGVVWNAGNIAATISGNNDTVQTIGNQENITATGSTDIIQFRGIQNNASIASGTVTLANGSQATVNGNGNNIEAGANASATINGNNANVSITSGSVSLSGSNAWITSASGANVTLTGADEAMGMSNGSVTLSSGSTLSLTGGNNAFTLGAGSILYVAGNGNQITDGGTNGNVSLNGQQDTVEIANGTVILDDGAQATVTGDNDYIGGNNWVNATISGDNESIKALSGDINVTGNNEWITAGANSWVTLTGQTDAMSMSSGSLLLENGSSASLDGDSNVVTIAPTGNMYVDGDSNAITANGANDFVTVNGQQNTVSIAYGTVTADTGSQVNVTGDGDWVGGGQNLNILVTGNNDSVGVTGGTVAVNGNNAWVNGGNGQAVTLTGSGGTVKMNTGTLTLNANGDASLTGNGNIITVGNGGTLYVGGNSNTVTANGTTDNITVNGTQETVTDGNGTVILDDSATASVTGDNDYIGAGNWVNLTVSGSNESVKALSGVVTISGNNDFLNAGNGVWVTFTGGQNIVDVNQGSVVLTANGSASVTGYGNTLTVGAAGNIYAAGTGNQITANGANDFVTVDGTQDTSSISYGTVTIDDSSQIAVTGDSNWVGGGNNVSVSVTGNNDSVQIKSGSVTLTGNNAWINGLSGIAVTVTGTGDGITMSGGTVVLTAGTNAYLTGNSNQFTVDAGGVLYAGGNDNSVTANGNADIITLNGQQDSVAIADGTAIFDDNAQGTVTGDGNWVGGGNKVNIVIDGDNDSAGVTSGAVTLNGDDGWINGGDATVVVTGDTDTVSEPTSGGNVTMTGDNDGANMSDGTFTLTTTAWGWLVGSSNKVTLTQGSSLYVGGNDNDATADGSGDEIIFNGQMNVAAMILGVLALDDSTSASLTGTGNQITVGNDDTLTVTGSGNTVTVQGNNSSVTTASAGNLMLGVGSNDTLTATGGHEIFIAGAGGTLNGGGNDDFYYVAGDGVVTISDTGNDNTLHLEGGISLATASFTKAANGKDLDVEDGVSGDQIRIEGEYGGSGPAVATVEFDDGSSVDLANGDITIGTGETTTLGNSSTVTIAGVDDDVTFNAGGNSIAITGSGDIVAAANSTITLANGAGSPEGVFQFKGIAFPSWYDGAYAEPAAIQSMQDLAATGANSIELVVTQYTDNGTSTNIGPTADTESDANLIAAIQEAQQLGLQVFLAPHLNATDGTYQGVLDPSDISAFFANYQTFIVHYAEIAQETGVQLLSIGGEMRSLSGSAYQSYWDTIIAAVRQVYSGKLTYGAADAEASSVSFWNELDYIGIDSYVPLTTSETPTVQQLVQAWTSVSSDSWFAGTEDNMSPVDFYHYLSESYDKPVVFQEVGYRSIDGTAIDPSNYTSTPPVNLQQQADAYQAFLDVWNSDQGNWMQGAFIWDWNTDPSTTAQNDFSPQGKPALATLTSWFQETAGSDQVDGNNNVVSLGTGAQLVIAGSSNLVSAAGTGDTVTLSGQSNTVAMSSGSVTLGDNSQVTLTGAANQVSIDTGTTLSISGSGDQVTVLGAGDTLTISSGTIALGTGGSVTATGSANTVEFGTGVADDQIWFAQQGNNLVASVIGTNEAITVQNWFTSSDDGWQFKTQSGQTLTNNQVVNLINAMNGLTPPAAGQTTLPAALATQLEPVIAANWH